MTADDEMAPPVSTPQQVHSVRVSAVAAAGVILGAVLLLGALALWFHYGTAVFFEMISSGIAGCF